MKSASFSASDEKKILVLLMAVQFNHVLDFVLMMPLGPQLMRAFSIGPSEFGLLVSCYAFSAAIFGLIGAFFIDRFDRKRSLAFLFAGFTLGTFLCAVSPNHLAFMGARSLAGAFAGVMSAVVFAILGEAFPPERRGRATGVVMASFSLASVLGIPFGLYLATRFEWHAPFFFLTALCVPVIFGVMAWMPSLSGHIALSKTRSALQSFIGAATMRSHQMALIFVFCLMLGQFTVIPYITAYMTLNVGLLESQLPYIYLMGGAFTFFTSRFFGKLADQRGAAKVFQGLAVFSLIPILVLTHLPPSPLLVAISVSTTFMVLVSGRMITGMTLVNLRIQPEYRGPFMSLNSTIQQIGSGVSAWSAGLILAQGERGELLHFNRVGYVAVGFSLVGIALSELLNRTRQGTPRTHVESSASQASVKA